MDSPEVRKANENLRTAIIQLLEAQDWHEDFLLTNYMVICTQTRFDKNGSRQSRYPILQQQDGMAWHEAIGLIECARNSLRNEFLEE